MLKAEHIPLSVIHALVMNVNKEWPDAIAAAINAWPGSYSLTENDSAVIRDVAVIILPLTENQDDKA